MGTSTEILNPNIYLRLLLFHRRLVSPSPSVAPPAAANIMLDTSQPPGPVVARRICPSIVTPPRRRRRAGRIAVGGDIAVDVAEGRGTAAALASLAISGTHMSAVSNSSLLPHHDSLQETGKEKSRSGGEAIESSSKINGKTSSTWWLPNSEKTPAIT
uniref:Uncharacterized protein n=1 Tax=Oryza glumipatula TaxID=40148 RepID=A0A0E0ABV8_9ORYZ